MKLPAKKPGLLANVMGFLGSTLTKAGDGMKRYSGSFTPVAGSPRSTPARQQSMAIQQAGNLPPAWQEKGVTPEQQFDTSLQPTNQPTAATLERPGETLRQPIKLESEVTPQRVQQYLLARFNPIRGLSPRLLGTYLEQFDLGFLRSMSLVWHKIKERDDQISCSAEQRECKPADMDWQIIQDDETPESEAHKLALEEFYEHLSVSHALDQNQRGGVQLLIKMMMLAVGDKFAPFEVVWRPEPDRLTADLRYLPPWFFENRTGQLRFLPYELALQGLPLEPGGWMVHVGKGLFAATSIAYLYKTMGLKTWVTYQEKFGIPFLHAKTNAEYQSEEWNGLKTAIENFSSDGGIVTKMQTTLEAMNVSNSGTMPHEPFCDRMDRAIARLWRGGDLSSMSRGGGKDTGGGGVGALPQVENESALAKTDAEMLSETCQFYLDRWVIRYRFGDDVSPKARFVLQPPQQVDTDREIKVDQFLLGAGVPQAISDLAERYGRNLPDEGDVLAHAPVARQFGTAPEDGAIGGLDGQPAAGLGNIAPGTRRFVRTATDLVAQKLAKNLAPLRARLVAAAAIEDPTARKSELEAIRLSLPSYVAKGVNHELVKVLEDSLSTAVVNGALEGERATQFIHRRNGHSANGHETFHR